MTDLERYLCDELELILAAAMWAAKGVEDGDDPYAVIIRIIDRATASLAKARNGGS